MNMKEYWKAVRSGANVREYDLKSRKIQRSLSTIMILMQQ